jgi:hypothetical protein
MFASELIHGREQPLQVGKNTQKYYKKAQIYLSFFVETIFF